MRRSSSVLLAAFLVLCSVPAAILAQGPSQQPVQDLTPPSDAQIDQMRPVEPPPGANTGSDTTTIAPPKEASKNKDESYTFKAQVEEVVLYATVVDPKNRQINNLTKDQFMVFEDGQRQQITSFRREDVPVSVGIVIDNSGSMREKRMKVNQAAINFVRASNKEDEVFVVNYNDQLYLDQDFTASVPLLKEALEKIEARGGTALYDAVVAAADHLAKGGKHEKKVLLVVTDGADNASRESLEEAVRKVQAENGPTVYSIGILDSEDRDRKRARRAMERISNETGGVAYFPGELSEVDEISSVVAHDIRNQYIVGYKPTRPQSEGGFRQVRIEARGEKGRPLQVRTKSGYYAGERNQKQSSSD